MAKTTAEDTGEKTTRDRWRIGKHDLHIFMADEEFLRLEAMAKRERRTITQQISYLMDIALATIERGGKHGNHNRD